MLHPSVWGVGILLVCVSRILMHSQDLFLALALSLSLTLSTYIQHIISYCNVEQLLTFISGYVKHFINKYSVYTKRGPSSIKGPLSGAR